jgi:putative toxin-antitoxin system antitoxin component (TIGR02293 family)
MNIHGTRHLSYLCKTNDNIMKALAKKAALESPKAVFTINFGEGKIKELEIESGYGFQIREARKARNLMDLNRIIGENGFPFKAVRPLVKYLDLTNDSIAVLTGVSSRTISRWDDDTTIGVMASKTLVEVDKLARKGVGVFGDHASFIEWLHQPNTALGDSSPLKMLSTPYGVEMVEDALEALEFGNVM